MVKYAEDAHTLCLALKPEWVFPVGLLFATSQKGQLDKCTHCLYHMHCMYVILYDIICIVSHVKCSCMITMTISTSTLTVRHQRGAGTVLTSKRILRRHLGNKYLLWCCSLTKSRAANTPQAENSGEGASKKEEETTSQSKREREIERAAWCWHSSSLSVQLWLVLAVQMWVILKPTADNVRWQKNICVCIKSNRAAYAGYKRSVFTRTIQPLENGGWMGKKKSSKCFEIVCSNKTRSCAA